jgi:hypothetical protein
MVRLMTMILFGVAATVLMGIGVVVVLSTNNGTWQMICAAAAAGFVIAIPVSWLTAKQLVGKLV